MQPVKHKGRADRTSPYCCTSSSVSRVSLKPIVLWSLHSGELRESLKWPRLTKGGAREGFCREWFTCRESDVINWSNNVFRQTFHLARGGNTQRLWGTEVWKWFNLTGDHQSGFPCCGSNWLAPEATAQWCNRCNIKVRHALLGGGFFWIGMFPQSVFILSNC